MDALEWCIVKEKGDFIHHYIDDLVVIWPADLKESMINLSTLKSPYKDWVFILL